MNELKQERTKLFTDIYDGVKPSRIPIRVGVSQEAAIDYCKMDLKKTQWDTNAYFSFMDTVSEQLGCDVAPVSMNVRTPAYYQILESKAFVMSSSGVMQHPEVKSMEPEEYDEFIADPYAFLLEKALPRIYPGFGGDRIKASLNLAKAMKADEDYKKAQLIAMAKINEKYSYAHFPLGGITEAPYDFLADVLRSFTEIAKDIRRCPEKIAEACDAVLPYMEKCAVSCMSSKYCRTMIPIHMPAFMNTKQFEKYYWPSFLKLCQFIYESGSNSQLLLQGDMVRYIDYINELPGNPDVRHEYGDMEEVALRTNKKHIITGLYPVTMLETNSKQECIDYAKKAVDILGRNGNYIFNFDKPILSLKRNSMENLRAVIATVREYGVY
ncbi:uroporphyrinogen decarboxylase [Desulfosporosinus fructosivorans]|uniref:Uroporphyrinogen decarboxylase n=1 Tax=Desulfosporosinus fructosivorans TaxID=2018669 RepID=A0A4Z0QXU9_9FIRM|nr:uroporphyrinogen decarboxylase family protein [Desulfosporosinus fructosivorans]TGE35119.1 uroporphyrinogen decarboxylase [Desulfosporosinus fructosivorans]